MSNFKVFQEQISDSESDTEITEKPNEQEETLKKYQAPYEKINDHVYIMRGKEKTQMNSERLVVYNNSKVSLFWGKCFMCGCVGHSQRFCPLKYCTKCQTYSHSVVTCSPNLRRYRNSYNRRKYANKYVNHNNFRRERRVVVVKKDEKETKVSAAAKPKETLAITKPKSFVVPKSSVKSVSEISAAIPKISVKANNGRTHDNSSSDFDSRRKKI